MPRLLTLLLASFALLPSVQAQTWETTLIADHNGMQPNLGVDPLGNLHLAWASYPETYNLMNYATLQSGGWDYYRPLSLGGSYWSPVVEGDSLGCFHITVRGGGGDAHYWTNNTDRWDQGRTRVPTETRYDFSGHGHHVSIEVFDDTTPQIFREMDGRIFHQRNTQQIFNDSTTAEPDHDGSVIHQWTTAVEDDVLHVAVRLIPPGSTDTVVFYTKKERGSYADAPWSAVEQVALGGWPSLIVRDGVPHVVYTAGHVMYYTRRTEGGWSAPENLGGGNNPAHTGIAVDDNGAVHAVWVEASNGIYYTNNIGGSWSTPSLAGTADGRDWHETHMDDKLALDTKSNTVYIAYSANDQVLLSHTAEFSLRDETSAGTTTLSADPGFTVPSELTLATASETCPLTILRFTITDAGDDGLPTEIQGLYI